MLSAVSCPAVAGVIEFAPYGIEEIGLRTVRHLRLERSFPVPESTDKDLCPIFTACLR